MADVERNNAGRRRERLIDAAIATFLEEGVKAPLESVVERARLGRATLYRNFPDRTSLILAMLDRSLARVEQAMDAAPAHDARRFVEICAMELVRNPALADAWRVIEPRSAELAKRQQRMFALFEGPLAAGIAAGELRDDLTLGDFPLIIAILGTVIRERTPEERLVMMSRLLSLLSTGIFRAAAEDGR